MTAEPAEVGPPPLRGATVALILACLALGGVSGLEMRHMSVAHGTPLSWDLILRSTMPKWLLLSATLPLVLRLATRPAHRWPVDAGMHAALFLVISFFHAWAMAWGQGLTSPVASLFPWSARLLRSWFGAMPTMVSMYGAVLAAAWALNEVRERERRSLRASQLETQLQTARLAALRARLHPHFLYNTLHGIAALVADARPERAVSAIEQLSELLHASLRDDGRDVVSVSEEMALAERYLSLQQMRFGERLCFQLDVAPAVTRCAVPVLILQPLVENAVAHGLDAGRERLQVIIRAAPVNDGVELSVENDGPGLDANVARSNGHGLGVAATRARLATAYGDRASLRLRPRDGGGVIVRLVVPQGLAMSTADAAVLVERE